MKSLPHQRASRAIPTAILLAAALTSCAGQGSSSDAKPSTPAGSSQAGASSGSDAKPGSVTAVLAGLPVKAAASKASYDRVKNFGPAWTDNTGAPGGHNHCDTRDDILKRDLKSVKFEGTSKCTVASGTLADPYTGKTIAFQRGPKSSAVQIDHLVALSDAWQTGAQQLPQAQREALANDPLNLVAADGPANMGKGDKDAASWLPANKSFDCTYVARQIVVKQKYHLWVTPAEGTAMKKTLETCPAQKLPTESSPDVVLKP
ncbi:HNH endonuclease family protein [Streptomyces noursei]|uniref:HNH endonuclease family protein n=1 Tax=Streptomyces noursei TaxID=1971 RepID=UPI0037F35EE8